MDNDSPNDQRLCWDPWPCSQCSEGFTPIGYLVRGLETGKCIQGPDYEKVISSQITLLKRWIQKCPHHAPTGGSYPFIAEGSEHTVYLDTLNSSVIKYTKPQIYGESYFLKDNKVFQKNASPLEYLVRIRLWQKVFGSSPLALGLSAQGQIVTRHEFIRGELPLQEEVDEFLDETGFLPAKRSCWLWKKIYPGPSVIWLGDARSDNFVKTQNGIVPIDIRLWLE